jgi:GDP-L-fucose synthase
MDKTGKIYIAGHNGMVGSSILKLLKSKGFQNIIFKSKKDLDLTKQNEVDDFFRMEQPNYVILAAAKVGGIIANNTYRAEFIYENLMIQNNIIHSAYKYNVKKLLFLGSSCIYPKNAPQPLKEEYLLTGALEQTNEPYAIAKIAGIKMCENYFEQYQCNFISVMPTNLYGPNDNYDLEKSHVLPALIRKFYIAKNIETNNWDAIKKDLNKYPIEGINGDYSEKTILDTLSKYGIKKLKSQVEISLWGSGNVHREFLHVDDMADASVFIMENIDASQIYQDLKVSHINIGSGIELSISELANLIKSIIGFSGIVTWDSSKPDGTKKKLLNTNIINSMNWKPNISLAEGIKNVFHNYQK